jgi:tetratricopeptide (TPR) repeat protein
MEASLMLEPVSMLGGTALTIAKAAIAKWIGGRIAESINNALSDRQLRQDRPAKDQQAVLSRVIKSAVKLTAVDLFGEDRAQQRQFFKRVCRGKQRDWPLVNGSDLDHIVDDMASWLVRVDSQSMSDGTASDPASHPYLGLLCEHVVAQFGLRAENNGMRNSILYPRWNRFCRDELLLGGVPPAARAEPASTFGNVIHGSVGTLIQGGTVMINTGDGRESPWPRRLGTIPPLAAAHQVRPFEQELTAAFAEDAGARCQVLVGGGGIGKTQIAAAYAQRSWTEREVDLLVWVDATSHDAISAIFAQAGIEFCEAAESEGERAAECFLNWLDRSSGPRWLVVLDGLVQAADLQGLWPPNNPRGRTIVTTQLRESALDGHGRNRIDLRCYTPEEALQYLTERLTGRPRLLEGAAVLAESLGYLPLALAHAAAYLLDRPGISCSDYVTRLADRNLTLDQLAPETFSADYPQSLTAALQLSIDRANQHEPRGLAHALLSLASLLAPSGIPAGVFVSEPARCFLTWSISRDEATVDMATQLLPARVIEDGLARLHRLNLIDHDGELIRIHALIQRVCRDRIDDLDAIAWADADALEAIWPKIEKDAVFSSQLRGNAAHLRTHTEPALVQGDVHPLWFLEGDSMREYGLLRQAKAHFQHLQQLSEGVLDPFHPASLAIRNNIAFLQSQAGDPAGVAGFEGLLRDREQILGADHPHTLMTRNNLAEARSTLGDLGKAITEYEALLKDYRRVMDPEHPDILLVESNLAAARGRSGSVARAVTDLEATLGKMEAVLGVDHPTTLAAMINLAGFRGEAGDPAGAAAELETLYKRMQLLLEPSHPMSLAVRNHFAVWVGKAGDADKAAAELECLLEDRQEVLGPNHPDTLITRSNLASWRRAERRSKAVAELAVLLKDFRRLLGPRHPDTLIVWYKLASALGESGDASAAVLEFETLLDTQLQVLDADHPDVLASRHNLAIWRRKTIDPEATVVEFETLLEDYQRIEGPNHPETFTVRRNLGSCRGEAGDPVGAARTLEDLLISQLHVLGRDHPDTLKTVDNLAVWLAEVGDSASIAMFQFLFDHFPTLRAKLSRPTEESLASAAEDSAAESADTVDLT